jgi:superfamily II DNA or RNA helicase
MDVHLHCGDSYVLVEPNVPEDLTRKLAYWHRSLEMDPRTHRRVSKGATRRLYSLTDAISPEGYLAQRLVTLPGFVALVRQELRMAGYNVIFHDERTPRPKYDMVKAMEGLREYQYECAYTAIWSGGGIIACPTGWGKTHIISSIIKAHSKEELCYRNTCLSVVITPGVDLAKKNYNDLVQQLPDREVGLVCTGAKRFSDDVQVVTPDSTEHIDMEDAGIVIYDEVHTMSYPRAEQVLRASRAMRFGFSATPSGRFDGADKVIEGVIGPVIYHRTYQQAIEDGAVVPLRVYWIHCPEPQGWRHYQSHDANYRNGVWRNRYFHELVRRIWDRIPNSTQALAMADKLEHLNALLPYLPGVTYAHGTKNQDMLERKRFTNITACSDKDRDRIYKQLADGDLRKIISTGIYRQGVNFPQLTVLVNLAGLGSEIISGQLPGRTSRVSDGKEYGFIVDFWHRWDTYEKRGRAQAGPILRDDMKRENTYRELGFQQMWVENISQIEFEFEEPVNA